MTYLRSLLTAAAVALASLPAAAQEFITVASTTSTENSGLFGHILPIFQEKTGIEVRVVAQGTGQALETGRRGDADVVFVHARAAEDAFVAEGWGVERHDVMYNDFVIVGPGDDPAGVKGAGGAAAAMAAIAEAEAAFASRGDDSGTHQAEKALWAAAGITPEGDWYRETGSGMGATLNTAAELPAYALTDRGTWISFQNRGDLTVLFEGDPALHNPYGVILVNPEKHPTVKAEQGRAFIDWLVSAEGQDAIASFKIDGEQLFFPSAKVPADAG
jgi:tungstate transport system substrate-binding protein